MRGLQFIVAIILALIVFVFLKLVGLLLHIALIGAAAGFVIGLVVTFMVRRQS